MVLSWNWDVEILKEAVIYRSKHLRDAWIGDYETEIFTLALLYFISDTLWVCMVPHCVKSPSTIIIHHFACLVYLFLLFMNPTYFWFMGSCLSIEANTWFLIARRVMNKSGVPVWKIDLPFGYSLQLKLISVCFYTTWFLGRCILYPYLLNEVWTDWYEKREIALFVKMSMQALFTFLNLKWTYNLIQGKFNYWRKRREGSLKEYNEKGL